MSAHKRKRLLWNVGKVLVAIGLISLALGFYLSLFQTPCPANDNACINSNNINHLVGFALFFVGIALIIVGVGAMFASRLLD